VTVQTSEQTLEQIRRSVDALAARRRGAQIMEVCGTHTMAIARNGLRTLLPAELKLISGPGCPVCVTGQGYIDQALLLAETDGVVIATYGDMVRVPGQAGSLAEARAAGAVVEVVYSADQAVELAIRRPDVQVVFLGVGFETTAPGTALAIRRAQAEGVANFSVLAAHKVMLPAMRALLGADDVRVDGYLCPGHVSVILGWRAYEPLVREFGRPCVVAGFEPLGVLAGIAEILSQLVADRPAACTVYPPVSPDGNVAALQLLDEVFAPADAEWRGLGVIGGSGLAIRDELAAFDAVRRFDVPHIESPEMPGCRCGDIISGRCSPFECTLFAKRCNPRDPVGPCMVSSEGACAAAYKYDRRPT